MARKRGKRPTNTLWIFCEGEKTEINYFNKLKVNERISRINIKVQSSDKVTDAVGVVKYAISFLKNKKRDFERDDLIYCVFDRDSNTNQHLEQALKLAKSNNLQIVFSNPCFEYWILCHFEYFIASCNPEDMIRKLKEKLGNYKKNDLDIYKKTKDKIEIAITHAKKVKNKHEKEGIKIISRESNPSTYVFELIEKIGELKD